MGRFRKMSLILLILSLFILTNSQTAFAAEEEYTYTVRLYAGNQGTLKNGGIDVSSQSASVSYGKDCAVVSGLKYGDTVYVRPQDAANASDERYYVKGVRRSGRDNSEAEAPTFHVACDRDFVVAYGVSGDMVKYTVSYEDMNGKELRESDVYYGNIGDRQYVSSRYIAGYQPQTLNLVKTLSANEAENTFTFQYAPVSTTQETKPGGGTTNSTTTTTTTNTTTTNTTITNTTTTNAAGGGAGAADGQGTNPDAADAQPDQELPDEDVPLDAGVGGDAAPILDEEVPLSQQKLEDLDDEEVPLAALKAEQAGLMGYFPVYAGIGAAAASILLVAGIWLLYRKRRKATAVETEKRTTVNRINFRKKP